MKHFLPSRRAPFDPSGSFTSPFGADHVRLVAVRGAAVTMLFQGLAFVLQFGGSIVLARLLSPADFGIVTMVTAFSLLLTNFGTNGFTEAIIQRDRLNHQLASNLFWINVAAGVGLMLAFAAAAPFVARFYGEPRVTTVAMALSLTIVFTTLSVQHIALLKRSMSFTVVSANEIIARAASLAVSIVLAWNGWAYWALVAGALVYPLASSAGAWTLCRWVPGPPRRSEGTGAMVRFALHTYGFFTGNYLTRNLDNLLVGSMFGPQSLGLYKRAYDMTVMPIGQLAVPLNAVAVPTLSRLADDSEKYRRYVLRSLATLAFIGMALAGGLALIGRDLFVLVFGQQWEESGRLFTFFAPGIGAMMMYPSCTFIYLSSGRPDRLLRWGITESVVFSLLFVLGLRWGPMGVACAWMTASWILLVPALWYAGKPMDLRVAHTLGAIGGYVTASALAFAGGWAAVRGLAFLLPPQWNEPMARTAFGAFVFAALYLGGVVALHGSTEPLRQFLSLARDAAGRRGVQGPTHAAVQPSADLHSAGARS
jgi:PST family polysaccharide transporter